MITISWLKNYLNKDFGLIHWPKIIVGISVYVAFQFLLFGINVFIDNIPILANVYHLIAFFVTVLLPFAIVAYFYKDKFLDAVDDNLEYKIVSIFKCYANIFKEWFNTIRSYQNKDEYDGSFEGESEYYIYDSTFRDIYKDDTGTDDPPTTKAWTYLVTSASLILLGSIFFTIIPKLMAASISGLRHVHLSTFDGFRITYLGFNSFSFFMWFLALGIVGGGTYTVYIYMNQWWKSQNADRDASALSQYKNDARVQKPEELAVNFDIFPDAGAHSKTIMPVIPLAHIMLNNDGVKTVEMLKRADGKTDYDEEDKLMNKNQIIYDEDGNVISETKEMFDFEFGEKLFDSSFIPRPVGKNAYVIRNRLRKRYSPNKLLYNPEEKFGKSKERTVAEKINNDWYIPEYEVQRPAGAYIVDTGTVNAMVLAMTRAGKGQTIIEPTIDMWSRSDRQVMMAINDPKGELYLKFYYILRMRGFQVVAFNLMEPSKTDIYNPLGYAIDSSRREDNQSTEEFVGNIGEVFFPPDKSDEPMWPNAANAAFKRTAFGLIDYYLEEEYEIRQRATKENWSISKLNKVLDDSWGHVTLYNVYQMMIQLASKKSNRAEEIYIFKDEVVDEKDYLTLFFDATAALPRNALRTSVQNQDQSLRTMAGSDKTIASVYGISLTAMKFFADEAISRLTSGRPSQNFDIIGLAFPRRFDVRIDKDYLRKKHLRTQKYIWSVYEDAEFKHKLEKDKFGETFNFSSNIDSQGWIQYVTKGIFPKRVVYLKLELVEQSTGISIDEFYFKFRKSYQMSLDGASYVIDPVSNEKVVKDGDLIELHCINGKYVPKNTVLYSKEAMLVATPDGSIGDSRNIEHYLFDQIIVYYKEEPSAVFFITPPHKLSYAKIILILLNQMFNMQVGATYLTLKSQKPHYEFRTLLDEVGNLQSEGSGIPALQTKESIGLGQGQSYILILQTLQQLKDVYGDSIDKILQGNTGTIIYLKSTDDSMLEILSNLSGIVHRKYQDSDAITNDMKKIFNTFDGKRTLNSQIKEEPLISKNDMLRIPPANAMVFGKRDVIWAGNQLALPFSYVLVTGNPLMDFENPQEYTLRTVPTTSNAMDFDILNNIPDFMSMVEKRVKQARKYVGTCVSYRDEQDQNGQTRQVAYIELDENGSMRKRYMEHNTINGRKITEVDMMRLDPEALAKSLMGQVNLALQMDALSKTEGDLTDGSGNDISQDASNEIGDMLARDSTFGANAMPNTEFDKSFSEASARQDFREQTIYAGGRISRNMVLNDGTTKLDIARACATLIDSFRADPGWDVDEDGNIINLSQRAIFVKNESKQLANVNVTKIDDDSELKDKSNLDMDSLFSKVKVGNDAQKVDPGADLTLEEIFLSWLTGLNDWSGILDGKFEKAVENEFLKSESN